jgi:hypothetical protein
VVLPTAFSLVAIRSKPLFSLLSLPSLTSLCRWRQSQRFRLLSLTSSNSTTPRTVRQTALDSWGQEYQLDVQTDLKTLNERFSDIKATNGPVQCEESLCEYLRETMNFVPKNTLEEMAGSSSFLSPPPSFSDTPPASNRPQVCHGRRRKRIQCSPPSASTGKPDPVQGDHLCRVVH